MSIPASALRYYDGSYPTWVLEPPVLPTATTLAPSSVVVNTPTPVTVTGTNFRPDSRVWVDGVQQHTEFISATQVRYLAEASAVGTQDVRVRTQALTSAALTLTVTATVGEEEA